MALNWDDLVPGGSILPPMSEGWIPLGRHLCEDEGMPEPEHGESWLCGCGRLWYVNAEGKWKNLGPSWLYE